MEPGHLPLLVLLPPLLAASAFVSSAETALFSLTHGDRVRLTHLSGSAAATVARLLEHPRALLITILLANNVINVTYFVVSSILSARADAGIAIIISIGSLLGLILLGEILPKLFARKKRVEFCRVLAPVMWGMHQVLTPIRRILDRGIIAPLTRLLRPAGAAPTTGQVRPEELDALLELSARRGEIDAEEQKLLAEVVELHSIRVRDAMVPRQQMVWLHDGATSAELMAIIDRSGRMRIPIFRGSQDGQVLGILDARRYLAAHEQPHASARAKRQGRGRGPHHARGPQITDFLTPALFIPELARLDQSLEQFRRQRVHEALCVDEFGAVVGAIRLEDILRELVAHPHPPGTSEGDAPGPAGEDRIEVVGPNRWLVPGRLGLRALTEFLAAPDVISAYQRVSTVAGAVIVSLGRLPTVGDTVTIGNVHLEVASMRGRSVEHVLVWMEAASVEPSGSERGDQP